MDISCFVSDFVSDGRTDGMSSTQQQQKQQKQGKRRKKDKDEASEDEGLAATVTEDERERLVKGIVRLMLFSADNGRPITRDDLNKRVMARLLPAAKASASRALFRTVLEEARRRLKTVFGFDLVNLRDVPLGGATAPQMAAATASNVGFASQESSQSLSLTQQQHTQTAPAATAPAKRPAGSATTSSYVLVNELPRGIAVLHQPGEGGDDGAAARQGLLMVVLALVVMNGGAASEDALVAHLHSLDAEDAFGLAQRKDLADLLARFVQQQYLARRHVRGTASAAVEGGASTTEYLVGARTLAEFSRVDILRFVAHVLGQRLTPDIAEVALTAQQDAESIRAAFAGESFESDAESGDDAPAAAAAAAAERTSGSSGRRRARSDSNSSSEEEQPRTQRRRRAL